jgi:2-polyprenyl-3-methyl-5-hydroxy-6-metoxy-1,4-benzoquinol methylase
MQQEVIKIVDKVYEIYKKKSIDLLNNSDYQGEYDYLIYNKNSYLRTIADILELFPNSNDRNEINILEIGSFLGVVAVSLANFGFNVYVFDIPEFQDNDNLKKLYGRHNILSSSGNLRDLSKDSFPYSDDFFDCVIICETLEHLNFNPLWTLYELNRIIINKGIIYISVPNQASLRNRIRLLMGQSVHNTIEAFYQQLNPKDNMIVGLHWREYTLREVKELLSGMGFEVIRSYLWSRYSTDYHDVKQLLKYIITCIPSFKDTIIAIGQKDHRPQYHFWRTEASS